MTNEFKTPNIPASGGINLMKTNILDFNLEQWQHYITSKGYPGYRAMQIFQWLHQKRVQSFDALGNVSKELKTQLNEDFTFAGCKVSKQYKSQIDETTKVLFDLEVSSADTHIENGIGKRTECETVWIPKDNSGTVCVSTQSGCSLDCSFCATGKIAFKGNLSSGQILTQIYQMVELNSKPISNVVFMGMGEPFMNYDESLKAAHMLSNDHALNISAKKITISTCGVLPGIKQFIEDKEPFNLAISIHTFNHAKRLQMVKAEKRWPLHSVVEYLKANRSLYEKHKIMLEYVLLSGVNMSEVDAEQLGACAKVIGAKVNLIPVNLPLDSNDPTKFKTPDQEEIDKFWKMIKNYGVEVFKRSSRGVDILAACGMLAGK